jgi:hypothetical protein
MNKKAVLEKVVIVFGIMVIIGACWFYSVQLGDTLDTLRMAYPD